MVAKTFRPSGSSANWSDPTAWLDGSVPVDGDGAITIYAGKTCIFDVDMSGWANGITSMAINGTLQPPTTPGNYYLKMSSALSGSGYLKAGDSVNEYPVGCKFTIKMAASQNTALSAVGAYQFYCKQPVYKFVKLSVAAALGDTVLHVDTNITADPTWFDGAVIRINDINTSSLPDSEERTIAVGGISSTTITITAGLTSAKDAGSYIVLMTRNVELIGTNTSTGIAVNNAKSPVLNLHIGTFQYCTSGGYGHSMNGVYGPAQYGVNIGYNQIIAGVICGTTGGALGYLQDGIATATALFVGCKYGLYRCSGVSFLGDIIGNDQGVPYCDGVIISGRVLYCAMGINGGSVNFDGSTLNYNVIDISYSSGYGIMKGRAALFTTNTPINSMVDAPNGWPGLVIYDFQGVAGEYRSWQAGGVVANDAFAPTGLTRSYKMTSSKELPFFWERLITIKPGQKLRFYTWFYKDTLTTYLPRVWVFPSYREPLSSPTVILLEQQMTNSLNTWENYLCEVANTSSYEREFVVRFLVNATAGAIVYTMIDLLTSGGQSARMMRIP